MTEFFVLVALLSFLQTGLIVDFYLLQKRKLVFSLPKFFGLGIGFIGLLQLLMGLFSLFINQTFVFSLFLILCLPFFLDNSLRGQIKKLANRSIKSFYKSSSFFKLTLFLFFLILASLFIQAFSHTIWGSDAYAFWLAKASAFFIDGRITAKNLFLYWPYDHPLLWPLTATWLYHFIGQASEYYFQAIPFTVFICLIVGFYKSIGKAGILGRIFWTAVLFFTPFLLKNIISPEYVGNADLLVSFYLFLSTAYLLKGKYLYTSLFLFFACFAKNDITPAVLAFLMVFPIFNLRVKKRQKASFGPWFLLLVLVGLHFFWKKSFGFENRYLASLKNRAFTKRPLFEYMWYTTNAFREDFRQIYRWGVGWWLIILAIFTNFKKLFKDKTILLGLLMIFIQFLSYFLVYYITPEDPASQIATSIFRLVLQLYPATLFLAYKVSYNK